VVGSPIDENPPSELPAGDVVTVVGAGVDAEVGVPFEQPVSTNAARHMLNAVIRFMCKDSFRISQEGIPIIDVIMLLGHTLFCIVS